jgi:3-methyladenine DNA glycosylase AlkC
MAMEPFKNQYNKVLVTLIAQEIAFVFPLFKEDDFVKVASIGISKLEMKARVDLIANSLSLYLPPSFVKSSVIIKKVLKRKKLVGFSLWPFSVFIEKNGINDFKRSMDLLRDITILFTSEFGVRPFYEKYPDETLKYLYVNIDHKNEHVRRWVSEGTRPNLPWGQNVTHISKNLDLHLKILRTLRNDQSLYVRKSVANHLSDITWIDQDLVIQELKKWSEGASDDLRWIIKQALRNLLKQGSADALQLLGYNPAAKVKINNFALSKTKVKEGDAIELLIDIKSKEIETNQFMVDYNLYYPKSSGKLSKKTFKGKNIELENPMIN